jgi:hypothetical protein
MKFFPAILLGGWLCAVPVSAAQLDDAAGDDGSISVVQGVVVDAHDRPVSGASVEAVTRMQRWVAGRTNSRGEFRIPLAEEATQFVRLIGANADAKLIGTSQLLVEPSPDSARITIRLKPARRVRVRVVDERGLPVPGALTEAVGSDLPCAIGQTDRDGVSILSVPADAKLQSVLALKAGLGFDSCESETRGGQNRPAGIGDENRLTLDKARSFRIVAVTRYGKAIPGLTLVPYKATRERRNKGGHSFHGSRIARAITDESGVATFNWLPADLAGMLTFEILTPGFITEQSPCVDGSHLPSELRIECRRASELSISGVVVHADGRPAAGIVVQAERQPGAFDRRFTRTQADGQFTLMVESQGIYAVGVVSKEWTSQNRVDVPVLEGRSAVGINFELMKGTLLRGKIFSSDPPSSEVPFVVQLVQVMPDPVNKLFALPPSRQRFRPMLMRSTKINPGAEYQFRVGPGTYELRSSDLVHHFSVSDEAEHVCHFTH